MKRDWTAAEFKRGDWCRACGRPGKIELAHIVGRARDGRRCGIAVVHPDSVVGLCMDCHRSYDQGTLDLLPHLSLDEQVQAVRDAGGLEAARRRIMGSQAYRKEAS